MRLGLRTRLLVPPVVLLVGIAGATAWAATAAARQAAERIADQLARVTRTLTEPPTFPMTQRVLEQMKGFSGADFVFEDRNRLRLQTFHRIIDLPAGLSESPSLGPPVRIDGVEYRGRRLRLTHPPNEGGTLFIFYPESLRRDAVTDAVRPPLVLGAVGGLLAVILTVLASGRLITRIRGLNARTRQIAAGDFTPTVVPPPDDELADLARAVNDMAGRLGDYRDRLKETERMRVIGQFAGGLAHQIRNAATGARLAIEVFEREASPPDPEPLAVARRQLGRIEQSVKQFLDLGRSADEPKTKLDVGGLLSETVKLFAPQCRHSQTKLRWTPPSERIPFTGSLNQLRHLFANLIGNAIDAAGPGGTVDLTVRTSPSEIVVEVADTGPGPPVEIAGSLFDPFVTAKPEGIGLGLAVAKQAADAHHGTIAWNRRGDRTVFFATLPRE